MVRSAASKLTSSLERVTRRRRRKGLPAPQVLVRSPDVDFEFGDLSTPFHAASVGKVMTAVLIGILIDRGDVALDTPIGALLPAADVAGLPAAPGIDPAADVTVEHLLSHRSGLPDFFISRRGQASDASTGAIVVDRDRLWTPSELVDQVRRLRAVGRPGERFLYSDTVFVLLGRIVEEAMEGRFSDLLRTHVYEPSGMERSSTPYSDATSPADLSELEVARFWVGRHEMSRALSMSSDWAGGGIVAPAEDLVRFQDALHAGRLISPALRERLTVPQSRMRPGIHYGAGLVTLRFGEFFPLLRGLPQPVGGLGLLATHMFYYPRQRAHVVLNFHSTREMSRSFQTHIPIARMIATMR